MEWLLASVSKEVAALLGVGVMGMDGVDCDGTRLLALRSCVDDVPLIALLVAPC